MQKQTRNTVANTKTIRNIMRALGYGGYAWTNKCADATKRNLAYSVSYGQDKEWMQTLQKHIADTLWLMGYTNKVKVTRSKTYGRDGGINYLRINAQWE